MIGTSVPDVIAATKGILLARGWDQAQPINRYSGCLCLTAAVQGIQCQGRAEPSDEEPQ